MTRMTRALTLVSRNTLEAKHRRTLALDAPPHARRRLLLDAARLEDVAQQWRAEAVKEAAKEARCFCGRRVSTLPGGDGIHCSEHDL